MNEVAALREQIEILEETIVQLKTELKLNPETEFVGRAVHVMGLSRQQAQVLYVLVHRAASTEQLLIAMRSPSNNDERDPQIAAVVVSQMRKKLAAYGLSIPKGSRGVKAVYSMPVTDRARVLTLLGLEDTDG